MIDEDSLKKLNEWFDDKERSMDTSYTNGQYSVGQLDLYDFCEYLTENEVDLIGIPCMVCAEGLWFYEEDLKKAYYR